MLLLNKIHLNHHQIILVALLVFSLMIRIANFQESNVVYNPDGNSLYLVASHIVKYNEFPLVGASTGYIQTLKKNPLYYYFAASFLLIKNDILFLELVNIIISTITILVVYSLARLMFGKTTALISAILFSFSQIMFEQAIFYMLDTFLTQTFILLSFVIMLLSYHKENFKLLLLGIFIFSFACAFYLASALFILPVIILLIFYILKKQKKHFQYFIGAYGFLTLTLALLFLPVFFYYVDNQTTISDFTLRKSLIPPNAFLPELLSLFYIFADGYFLNLDKNILSINNLVFLIIMGVIINALLYLKKNEKRENYIFILISILTPLLIIALFQINRPFYDPQTMRLYGLLRYFLASIVLFIILIADVINSTFSKGFLSFLLKIALIITLIYVSFPTLPTYLNDLSGKLSKKWQINRINPPAVEAIKKEIYSLREEENFTNYNFFQIITYNKGVNGSYTIDLSYFWVILERDLNTKLVKIDNNSIYTYSPAGGIQNIFLVCRGYSNIDDIKNGCIDTFIRESGGYFIVKQIYDISPYSIYLSKRTLL